jgi:hypothetical protein
MVVKPLKMPCAMFMHRRVDTCPRTSNVTDTPGMEKPDNMSHPQIAALEREFDRTERAYRPIDEIPIGQMNAPWREATQCVDV